MKIPSGRRTAGPPCDGQGRCRLVKSRWHDRGGVEGSLILEGWVSESVLHLGGVDPQV